MARQKEVAIRSALGASRVRLLRQLLTESLLLSLVGGGFGLLLAWGGVALFSRAESYSLPQFNTVQLNGTVLAFTFVLAIATGVLFGVFPALQTSRSDMHGELKGGAGSSISPGRRRRFTSNVLVVAEIALSLMLLVSAGLLLKDFARLRSVDIGVRRDGVWTAAVQLPEAHYKTDRQQYDFSQSLSERLRRIGGVEDDRSASQLAEPNQQRQRVEIVGDEQVGPFILQRHERRTECGPIDALMLAGKEF